MCFRRGRHAKSSDGGAVALERSDCRECLDNAGSPLTVSFECRAGWLYVHWVGTRRGRKWRRWNLELRFRLNFPGQIVAKKG